MEQVFSIRELFDEIFNYIEPIDYHINSLVCKQWYKYILRYVPEIKTSEEYMNECKKGNYMAIVHTKFKMQDEYLPPYDIARTGYLEMYLYHVLKYNLNYENLAYCLISLYSRTYPNQMDIIKRYDKVVSENLFNYNKIKYKHFGEISSMTNFFSRINRVVNELYLGEFLINDINEMNLDDYNEIKIYHNQCMCIGCVVWNDNMFKLLISNKKPFTDNTILLPDIRSIRVNALSTPVNDCSENCIKCQDLHLEINFNVETDGTLRCIDFKTIRDKLKTYTVKSDDPDKQTSDAFMICPSIEFQQLEVKNDILYIDFRTWPDCNTEHNNFDDLDNYL